MGAENLKRHLRTFGGVNRKEVFKKNRKALPNVGLPFHQEDVMLPAGGSFAHPCDFRERPLSPVRGDNPDHFIHTFHPGARWLRGVELIPSLIPFPF